MTDESGKEFGRNEPCHCGSGKKYKRCHGVGAAPKLTAPKQVMAPEGAGGGAPGGFPGGFDPSKMDPQMMLQFSQALQRLPKGQLQRLQSIMQRAMSGKDVRQESEEFERSLPPDLQRMMISFATQMQGQMPGGQMPSLPGEGGIAPGVEPPSRNAEMDAEEARKIVAAAAAEGKISKEEADRLLAGSETPEKKAGLSKLWRGITGKNP